MDNAVRIHARHNLVSGLTLGVALGLLVACGTSRKPWSYRSTKVLKLEPIPATPGRAPARAGWAMQAEVRLRVPTGMVVHPPTMPAARTAGGLRQEEPTRPQDAETQAR
ncbi:MAG: hypothetical protein RLZZ450_5268 [Pseudomonadota bacterium]|jgi:hypothetical protein